jgi:hypothetical protein
MEDTKSNDRCPSTVNSQNTQRPLLASGWTEEDRRGRIEFREVGNADFDGHNGQYTTASDRFEVKGVIGEPTSSYVESVLMWHIQTEHVPYYSQGFYKRQKWGNAMGVSSHRVWRDEHLSGTEIAKTAGSSGQTSICHDSRPEWPGNGSCKRKSKNGIHGSIYSALSTGSRIGGASRHHAGL